MADPTTWRAHIDRHLDNLQAGLLDLIDCGLPDDTHTRLRHPSDDEITSTRRGQDRDADYATPIGHSRSNTIPNPVLSETLRWYHTVVDALADLDQLIDAWAPHARTVADRGGTTVGHATPRPLPHTVHDPDRPPSPTINPKHARRATLARLRWLAAAADAIADYWTSPAGAHVHDISDVLDHWAERAHTLEHLTHRTARRHGRPDVRDRRCSNPRGKTNHPLGNDSRGDLCGACRKALQRANAE